MQAIERAAAILDLLGQFPQGLSVGDVAAKTGLPKGTAHRLLSSLVFFDFVRQEAVSKRYRLGFKLVELGNKLLDHLDLRENAAADQIGKLKQAGMQVTYPARPNSRL